MTESDASSSSSTSPQAMGTDSFSYTEFKPVPSSRKRRKQILNRTTPSTLSHITALCGTLAEGEWFTKCSNLLKEAWGRSSASVTATAQGSNDDEVRVLCLGLGSPCASKDARIQLAFLLEACKILNIPQTAISVYDPVFTRDDVTLLERMSVKVLDQPRKGADVLTNPTILFMPHCDLDLYESVLCVNQQNENLSRLFLVGNSLQGYLDSKSRSALQSIAPCVLEITPRLAEIPLPACTAWPTAFNNTSIQFFEVAGEAAKKPDAGAGGGDASHSHSHTQPQS